MQGDASVGDGLAWAVHDLAVGVAALDAVMARTLGVNHTDYVALKHLVAAEPALTPAQLARRLGLTTGSTTAVVDRLVRAGYIERRRHLVDRRKIELIPTGHAVASAEAALGPIASDIADLAQDMSATELGTVRRFLSDLSKAHTRRADSG